MAPAPESLLAGVAVAQLHPRLLADLTAAYCIDRRFRHDVLGDYGIRHHQPAGFGPMAGCYVVRFLALLRFGSRPAVPSRACAATDDRGQFTCPVWWPRDSRVRDPPPSKGSARSLIGGIRRPLGWRAARVILPTHPRLLVAAATV